MFIGDFLGKLQRIFTSRRKLIRDLTKNLTNFLKIFSPNPLGIRNQPDRFSGIELFPPEKGLRKCQ